MKKYTRLIPLLAIFVVPVIASATDYTVTNTNDSGAGSLREAYTSANSAYGPDNIYFNIPTSDPGYNASSGTWTIQLQTTLPYLATGYITIDGTTQTVNQGNTNPEGPEIVLDGNNAVGYAFCLVSPGNMVKGLVIGRFTYGIQIYNTTATQNTISGNYIGITPDGFSAFSNEVGIAIGGSASGHTISDNVISGNTMYGIATQGATNITITGNKIGCDHACSGAVANDFGIALDQAAQVTIGGTTSAARNIISGNTTAGIAVNGQASYDNTIKGNYIGTDEAGVYALPNGNGIMVVGSGNNTIGGDQLTDRNLISGNLECGILLNGSNTNNNIIKANLIGTDITGSAALSNHIGIVIKSNGKYNTIGGTSDAERNIISGNLEIGIYIEASDSNLITGNYIGPDISGTNSLANGDTLIQANGIEFNSFSRYNRLGGDLSGERNVVSGNRVYGMIYYGNCAYNAVIGNYIGTDATGNAAMPNATGICVDAGSNHNPIYRNVLSGNISYGIFIVTTNSYYNEMKGNLVGTNTSGTAAIPNDAGLLLGGGARFNIIGGSGADRNVFSGNTYAGIEIADNMTDSNQITGNYIGTDITGMTAVPNYTGIGISSNPKHNTITQNVVSGNTGMGIIVYENADSNRVTSNYIGTAADNTTDLGNAGAGVVLGNGASYNFLGNNTIAFNDSSGVVILDNNTKYNTLSQNSIYDNEFLGIELFPEGINYNDAGDSDDGPNDLMNFPEITSSVYSATSGNTWITGTLDTQSPQNTTIEIFFGGYDDIGYGEGKYYAGSAVPDMDGTWQLVTGLIPSGADISATATDGEGSTSEFSASVSVITEIESLQEKTSETKVYYDRQQAHIVCRPGEGLSNRCRIELTDINGKLLYQQDYSPDKTGVKVLIPAHGYNAGYYYVGMSDNRHKETNRILIF